MMQAPPENSLADEIRQLMRASRRATLGSLTERDGLNFPFVSLVVPAIAADAAPLLLISDLADHSKNLRRQSQASLLFDGTLDLAEPLTGPRVSLLGDVAITTDADDRAAYLAQNPSAELYAGFGDFSFYRFTIREALFVAGFGRIHRLAGTELHQPV
jgi:putative heme iron utilization protein